MDLIDAIRKKIIEHEKTVRHNRLHDEELPKPEILINNFGKASIFGIGSEGGWKFSFPTTRQRNSIAWFEGELLGDSKKICLWHAEFCNHTFTVDMSLLLECTKNTTITFKNCHFQKKFKICNIEEEGYGQQQNNKAELKKLEFIDCTMGSADSKTYPYLRVGFLNVTDFLLKNLRILNDAEVNIGDCRFEDFQLSNIRNLGKFKLYKINILDDEKGCKFQIDNTSLGDADFQALNLISFKTKKIYDNILSGVKYTNVRWERHDEDIEVETFATEFGNENELKRDTYRVLKIVAMRNDDSPQALAFFAKEMKFHREVIGNGANSSWQDKLILAFNYYTNNFGLSWLQPITLIVGLGVAFYSALLISLNGGYIFASASEWLINSITEQKPWEEALLELWSLVKSNTATLGKFFVFLNPTHKTEFVVGRWGFWAYTIDFAFRAIEASLIYQAIQAFRRYARKF